MKKLASLILATLTAFTLIFTATACGGNGNTNEIHIGILQVATHSALDSARLGFKEVVDAWAKENGKTIVYDEQNANGDPTAEVTIAEGLAAKNPSLMLGIATSSARALANSTGKIPVLFTAVTAPAEENLLSDNVTGTSDMNPVAEQIALIKEINPNVKKIGFLYNSSENNSRIQCELAKAKCQELDINLVEFTASLSSEIATVVESIPSDVEAVYIPTDNLMAENISLICNILHSKQIPVIGGEEGMCGDEGAVATLGIDYFELGKQTGEMAVAILSGAKNVKDIEFQYYNQDPSFFINETNALAAGLSQSLIDALKANHQ